MTTRRRVALVHDLPVGGAKRNFSSMLPALAERFDITVFEFDRADQSVFELTAAGCGLKQRYPAPSLGSAILSKLPIVGQFLLDRYLIRHYRPIVAAIHEGRFDVVMVTQSRIANTPPLLGMLRLPVVYACHEPTRSLYEPYHARFESPIRHGLRRAHNLFNHWLARLRERRLIEYASVILANSYYSAEVFYRLFARPSIVAYPGVDLHIFRYFQTAPADTVLSVGSLDIVKGHDFVIECVARVALELRPRLVVVCPQGTHNDAEAAYLRRLAAERGVTIEILSGISDGQLAERYASAVATLFCSRLEPFGLVSVEAMACGCPVLALAEGGLRETVVDEETGYLLPRDPHAFAEKLTLLVTDDAERRRLGANGVRRVREKFTWARYAMAATAAIELAIPEGAPSAATPSPSLDSLVSPPV